MHRHLGVAWALAFVFTGARCSGGDPADSDPTGAASIAITSAPADVSCVRLTVMGSRTVVRSLDVTPGQSTIFTVTGLPIGMNTFTAEAFDVACASVADTSVPTWLSNPVQVTIASGMLTPVTLQLRRNGASVVSIDFVNEGTVGTAPPVLHVATGSRHSCAVVGQAVKCWGANEFGQLGDGTRGGPSTVRTAVLTLGEGVVPIDITVGGDASCALLSNGTVSCWGLNTSGQLGDSSGVASNPFPNMVNPNGLVSAIASGGGHTCAIRTSRDVVCWGNGSSGQLGNGGFGNAGGAVQVSGIGDAEAITAGRAHTCAKRAAGTILQCWGENVFGQLGNGEQGVSTPTPTNVTIPGIVESVSAGSRHTCAIVTTSGQSSVYCWGSNQEGQFGDRTFNASATPTPGPMLTPRPFVISAGYDFTCALTSGGGGFIGQCWGANALGQVGDSSQIGDGTNLNHNFASFVSGGGILSSLSAGQDHACAGDSRGGVVCWGSNTFGELGRSNVGGYDSAPGQVRF